MRGKGLTSNRSPQKSIAIKGPPKIINEQLEIDSYQGVKVTGISVKAVNMSIAQLRAKHESSSVLSAAKHEPSMHHEMSGQMDQQKLILNSQSQHFDHHSSMHDPNFGQDAMSHGTHRMKPSRTIMEILHDRIANFVSRGDTQENFGAEFGQLKIENDMVNTFFDEIHKMSDAFTF